MAQLIEFGCEKCFRDHVEANPAGGIPSMEAAHATFAVLFDDVEDTFEAAEALMDTDAEVRCPRGHVVPVDEMRSGLEIDDQTVPRGERVLKRKRSR
jgi:hypothetical protein